MQHLRKIMLLFLSACVAFSSQAQYFSKVYDFDSTGDGGMGIFLNNDNTFQIWGLAANINGGQSIGTMKISSDGSHLLYNKTLYWGAQVISIQQFGGVKKGDDGNYFFGIDLFGYSAFHGSRYSIAGFAKFNKQGDTVLFKTYTDSSVCNEIPWAWTKISNQQYLIGGQRHYYTTTDVDSLFLYCVDSLGNKLWSKTYYKLPGNNSINSLQLLPNGQILVGACGNIIAYKQYAPNPIFQDYHIKSPWFMIIDTLGNIVRDTIYSDTSSHFIGGGFIYADLNGGYYHFGYLDSFFTDNPLDRQNLPIYLAHLDTNFKSTWVTNFADNFGRKDIDNVKQLKDGGYLMIGSYFAKGFVNEHGWLARLDANGKVLWDHNYVTDADHSAYLTDIVELPNGHIVATGLNGDNRLPSWHYSDVWLLEIDANGCEVAGCSSGLAVPRMPVNNTNISIYPNPTTGNFTINTPEAGTMQVIDMQGKLILATHIKAGTNDLNFPQSTAAGIYFVQYKNPDNTVQLNTKLSYQP